MSILSAICLLAAFSCATTGAEGGSSAGNIYTIYLLDKPGSGDWGIWYWLIRADGSQNEVSNQAGGWPKGAASITKRDKSGDFQRLKINDIDSYEKLGILFVNKSTGAEQTSDVLIPVSELRMHNTLYFSYSNPKKYYYTLSEASGIMTCQITNPKGSEISFTASKLSSVSKEKLSVADADGKSFSISSVDFSGAKGKIILADGDIMKSPYTVTYDGKSVTAPLKTELIDEVFKYDGRISELGLTVSGSKASFKMWAPLATEVQLALFADAASSLDDSKATLLPMSVNRSSGIWNLDDVDVSSFRYYKYAVKNGSKSSFVADIWAKACSADSVASQITDINVDKAAIFKGKNDKSWGTKDSYYNPFNGKNYSQAVIYEMHIRDWSRAIVSDSTGKFLQIAESEKIISHLKDLGVTHVQILPMFDYAQVNSDSGYNWGYNPYHYNVPEGRYVTNGYKDGTQAVREMRQMISALHDAGIAVIMDVVYNHTNSTGENSLYDKTVPQYFYRVKADGSYSNGSGCGNEVATNHDMVRKYLIESLRHWMLDYHINGFRFDLMGLAEKETMKAVYDELYKIDPKVMVYGEPWAGGSGSVLNPAVAAGKGASGSGWGAFDDDFRDAIKGGEFGGFRLGQVQGSYSDGGIIMGLTGKSGSNKRNETGLPELAIHYAECHDNYTLYDKLAYSLDFDATIKADRSGRIATVFPRKVSADQLNLIKKQSKLTAAYLFLSQGTPFINGGQEFLRSKKGNPDSYSADKKGGVVWTNEPGENNIDDVNTIDFAMKDSNRDVYNIYKGLIALRKSNADIFGNRTDALARVVRDEDGQAIKGVTEYYPAGENGGWCIYFNASDEDLEIDTEGFTKQVDVSDGLPKESAIKSETVSAKSFVILKK